MPKLILNPAETYALRTALRDLAHVSAYGQLHAVAQELRESIPKPNLVLSEVRSDANSEVFCEIELVGREATAAIISLQELRGAPDREYARLRALAGRLLDRLVPKRVLEEV